MATILDRQEELNKFEKGVNENSPTNHESVGMNEALSMLGNSASDVAVVGANFLTIVCRQGLSGSIL
jgi:hypothetical protein